ncbi:glutathione S-transferase [Labrenzia sp. 011]|uniref:glutathione S-transferase n=1 Tax=Labrenzia sp. 011 TaxID=2171494 RepID=UPI000D510F84|nr:glutathione S-transferase [Labrenzia sp. 011]PVB60789.1 glutathione S-transferase [Labrenzia sp. 011]
MSEYPILYSFRRCPYAMRARLAIACSGRTVELREVLLRDKAPEFLATSPTATVPCLRDGERVLDESLDIMLWALGDNDPEGWLLPEGGDRTGMSDLIGICDGPFKHHLDRYKYDTRYPDADREEERALASVFLRQLEDRLTAGPWLFGARSSLADFAILPFVRQFANTDRDWFEAESWPGLKTWLGAFEVSDRFRAIMHKWPAWQAGDDPILFPEPPATTLRNCNTADRSP